MAYIFISPLTAAGTVPDFHRLPYETLASTNVAAFKPYSKLVQGLTAHKPMLFMTVNMRSITGIFLVINIKSILIAALAVISTWFSLHYNIQADFPLTIISTAIVFPIVFSIGHAYKRRENALDEYGSIKGHGRALYYAARDWLKPPNDHHIERIETALGHLLGGCKTMFTGKKKDLNVHEHQIYSSFSELSLFVQGLREDGLSSGEVSRCNQYISKMIVAFENIKHIYQYRTPRTLRAFSDFFIVVLPILYGPYFAHEAINYHPSLIYIMPALFAIILVGLDNIQDHLEDPFDQIGADDIHINAEKFVANLKADAAP